MRLAILLVKWKIIDNHWESVFFPVVFKVWFMVSGCYVFHTEWTLNLWACAQLCGGVRQVFQSCGEYWHINKRLLQLSEKRYQLNVFVYLWLYVFFSWQSELDVSFISVITQSIIDQTWLWLSSVMHVYLWGFHSLMHNQIMFNLDKVHIILDEMILNGHIVETNKNQILAPLLALDKMAESWSNANEISLIFSY